MEIVRRIFRRFFFAHYFPISAKARLGAGFVNQFESQTGAGMS
jgi:hypothetical protein